MKRRSAFYKLILKIHNCSQVLDHSTIPLYHIPSTSLSSLLNFILSYAFKLLWPFIILLKVLALQLLIFFGSVDGLPRFSCACQISVLQGQEAELSTPLFLTNQVDGLGWHPLAPKS